MKLSRHQLAHSRVCSAVVTAFNTLDQPPLKYLTLYRDNGGTQPTLDISTQIAEGMASINQPKEITSSENPISGA